MAFCKGGMSAVRKLWSQITPTLEDIVDKVTDATKIIKDLKDGPIGSLLSLIPGAASVLPWLNTALDLITGITNSVSDLEEKITEYLGQAPTELDKNARLLKLASVATMIGHKEANDPDADPSDFGESFYDSAVQLHIITQKAAA